MRKALVVDDSRASRPTLSKTLIEGFEVLELVRDAVRDKPGLAGAGK